MKFIRLIAIIVTIVMSFSVCLGAIGKGGGGGNGKGGQGHGHLQQGNSSGGMPGQKRKKAGARESAKSTNNSQKTVNPPKEVKSSKAYGASQSTVSKKPGKPLKTSKPEKHANKSEIKGQGQGHAQQLTSLQLQLRHEKAKHLRRQARLGRIRELAVAKGDTNMIDRVDLLISKEGQRFGQKWHRMEQRQTEVNAVLKAETNVVTGVSSVPDLTKDKHNIKKPNLPKPVLD